MANARQRLKRVEARVRAQHAPAVMPCATAADLWERIYGHSPDNWQRDLLLNNDPRILMNCCRQAGKSQTSAIIGLFEALYRPPALILLISASLRQAQELGMVLFSAYRRLGKPVSPEAENRLSLELANASRILCLPAKEATIRGLAGARLIVVDEAARVPDPLYHSVRPMLAVSAAGRLIALSTPFGKRGWWYQAWTEEDGWRKVQIDATQCPRISAEFLAEERRSLPDVVFRQEYLTEFCETLDAVFRYEDIQAALSESVTPLFPTVSLLGGRGNDAQAFVSSELFSRA